MVSSYWAHAQLKLSTRSVHIGRMRRECPINGQFILGACAVKAQYTVSSYGAHAQGMPDKWSVHIGRMRRECPINGQFILGACAFKAQYTVSSYWAHTQGIPINSHFIVRDMYSSGSLHALL
jgi:hypothetical protein